MARVARESTVYDDLLKRIRRSISIGEMKPGAFIGSEYELARESGISRVSVRRATDLLMREGLVERRPGKGLFVRPPNRSVRLVQVVVPNMAFDQCVQIARGAQALGMERGAQTQVYDAHSNLEWDIETLRQLPQRADAAIIVSWHHPRFAESLYELKQQGFHFVLVDEAPSDLESPSVTADNYGGGYAVGKALIAEGHKRVGFIGNLVADTVRARLDGLRDAMNDAGIAFDRSLVAELDVPLDGDWEAAISNATERLLKRSSRATALFFSDDQTAAHAYGKIRSMGLRVPEDVSVAGFDDNPICKWLNPQLSTVHQPSLEMGTAAMEMVLDRLGQTARRDKETHQVLPTKWVPRGSVGKAPRLQV